MMNEPRITGSIQQLTECGAFANTDLNEVVKFFQNEAEGDSQCNQKHKVT